MVVSLWATLCWLNFVGSNSSYLLADNLHLRRCLQRSQLLERGVKVMLRIQRRLGSLCLANHPRNWRRRIFSQAAKMLWTKLHQVQVDVFGKSIHFSWLKYQLRIGSSQSNLIFLLLSSLLSVNVDTRFLWVWMLCTYNVLHHYW